jgi:hypothetical protein
MFDALQILLSDTSRFWSTSKSCDLLTLERMVWKIDKVEVVVVVNLPLHIRVHAFKWTKQGCKYSTCWVKSDGEDF